MKITVLGEYAPYPAAGGATAGYLVQTEAGNILIDCGSGVLSVLTKYISLTDLNAVIITHYHADHVADLGVLQYAVMVDRMLGNRTEPLHVYANLEPAAKFQEVTYQNDVTGIPIHPASKIELCGTAVEFANTKHAMPCLAVAVTHKGKKFVFSGDTTVCPEIERIAADADLFICEASWLEKDKGPEAVGHLTAREAGEIAKRANVKKLLLTHIYPEYNREELRKEAKSSFGEEVAVAEQGMAIQL
jgi:ribonuclease BN (tRNA processing enzyme)